MASGISGQRIADKPADGMAAAKDLSAVGRRQLVDEARN